MPRSPVDIAEPTRQFGGGGFTCRPQLSGFRGVVTAGHQLAVQAGMRILQAGGNAIDAGVAMGFCLAVLEPPSNGIGGESPMLIHHAASGRTVAINGQGVAPQAATPAYFAQRGITLIPGDGLLAATVPSQVSNFLLALDEFGTLPLAAVLQPAIDLAEVGYPVFHQLARCLTQNTDRFNAEWPGSAALYLPGGRAPRWGDRQRNPEWAAAFRRLIEAEREAAQGGRSAGIEAARAVFYSGPIAERIAEFCRTERFRDDTGGHHGGLLTYEDLGAYRSRVEAPATLGYRGVTVCKCGPWSQGPVFLQQLSLLAGFDLGAMGHNCVETIHTIIECTKLAFADREYFYGDPDFVQVPLDRLLSSDYAEARRRLIDPASASPLLQPGDGMPRPMRLILGDERSYNGDTTHLDCIDAAGNMIAVTPSGGWIQSSPVIPGLGFPLGTRAQMFSLDPEHPNCVAPGKRPRTTLTPSLALRDGRPWMVFGTPGGDQQDQWTLQFFLNVVDFGMTIQEALEAPTFHSQHFPSSFYPRAQYPRRVEMEGRIDARVRAELAVLGHAVEAVGPWVNGRVLAIARDPDRGLITGGASPRGEIAYALAY